MEKIENIVTSQKGSVKKRVTDKVDYVIYNPSKLKNGWSDKEWDKEQKKCEMAKMLKEEGNSIALMSIREFMETQGILYQEKIEQSGWEEWAGEWPSGFANATWEYDWSEIATDVEKLADMIDSISANDTGIEEVEINMQTKEIKECARFIMRKK